MIDIIKNYPGYVLYAVASLLVAVGMALNHMTFSAFFVAFGFLIMPLAIVISMTNTKL